MPAPLTVATYNLYLGADLVPVLRAGSPGELLAGAAQAWADVGASRPVERLQQVARLLAREGADVVGLQEVALWRTRAAASPGEREGQGEGEDADDWVVHLDALAVLLEALAVEGVPYRAASVTRTFSSVGWNLPIVVAPDLAVELSDRCVLLVREGLEWSHARSGLFDAALTVDVFGMPIRVDRGWASVDVHLPVEENGPEDGVAREVVVRVVGTHLEAFDTDARSRQAHELIAVLVERAPLPTVVVGDLNCRPVVDGSGDAYEVLTTSAEHGLADAWTTRAPRSEDGDAEGFTCGQAPDLRNPVSTLDHRIDVVLFDRARLLATHAHVTGGASADRTASGLWPSDHAGVVATLASRQI